MPQRLISIAARRQVSAMRSTMVPSTKPPPVTRAASSIGEGTSKNSSRSGYMRYLFFGSVFR